MSENSVFMSASRLGRTAVYFRDGKTSLQPIQPFVIFGQ